MALLDLPYKEDSEHGNLFLARYRLSKSDTVSTEIFSELILIPRFLLSISVTLKRFNKFSLQTRIPLAQVKVIVYYNTLSDKIHYFSKMAIATNVKENY